MSDLLLRDQEQDSQNDIQQNGGNHSIISSFAGIAEMAIAVAYSCLT